MNNLSESFKSRTESILIRSNISNDINNKTFSEVLQPSGFIYLVDLNRYMGTIRRKTCSI